MLVLRISKVRKHGIVVDEDDYPCSISSHR